MRGQSGRALTYLICTPPLAVFLEIPAEFYLILDVAVGGTNGWFPGGMGNKPWLDESSNALFCLFFTILSDTECAYQTPCTTL